MRTASLKTAQHGAALLIMVIILVLGMSTVLLHTFNSTGIANARQHSTAYVLAQAKQALIGRATQDSSVLGSLPCPDSNNDGLADLLVGNDCPSYIGRLPWKTLAIDDLRDGQGERLWYALSRNFRDDNSNHINSDTLGTLNITGVQTATQVIAIIFAAGRPINQQSRSETTLTPCLSTATSPIKESVCAKNYLEGTNPSQSSATGGGNLNVSYQTASSSDLFNDQLLLITHEQLFPLVEMRIAREVKACLDGYARGSNNKYPWAAPAHLASFTSTPGTLFGHLPKQPVTALTSSPGTQTDLTTDLSDAANAVIQLRKLISSVRSVVDTAGDWAVEFSNGQHTATQVQGKLNNAFTAVNALVDSSKKTTLLNALDTLQTALNDFNNGSRAAAVDTGMLASWANIPACSELMDQAYWNDWKNLVFYQISAPQQPGSNTPNACPNAANPSCLSINGQGSYRAVVLIARQLISPQNRNTLSSPPTDYLEGGNAHTATNPANNFISNRPISAGFNSVNDLVLCLDGQQTCQ